MEYTDPRKRDLQHFSRDQKKTSFDEMSQIKNAKKFFFLPSSEHLIAEKQFYEQKIDDNQFLFTFLSDSTCKSTQLSF